MFTINRMLNFESVRQRLARESPLTFLEFNYMILQVFFIKPPFLSRGTPGPLSIRLICLLPSLWLLPPATCSSATTLAAAAA